MGVATDGKYCEMRFSAVISITSPREKFGPGQASPWPHPPSPTFLIGAPPENCKSRNPQSRRRDKQKDSMPKPVAVIGIDPRELRWLRMLLALLRHPDPSVAELARQALLYLSEAECALAEAACRTGLERNGDVVRMASYAPLFAHIDGWQWKPDLIWTDNLRSYGTPNYYEIGR